MMPESLGFIPSAGHFFLQLVIIEQSHIHFPRAVAFDVSGISAQIAGHSRVIPLRLGPVEFHQYDACGELGCGWDVECP